MFVDRFKSVNEDSVKANSTQLTLTGAKRQLIHMVRLVVHTRLVVGWCVLRQFGSLLFVRHLSEQGETPGAAE